MNEFEGNSGSKINEFARRFEQMLDKNEVEFVDIDQLIDLINHYLLFDLRAKASKAISFGKEMYPLSKEFEFKHAEVLMMSGKHLESAQIIEDLLVTDPLNTEYLMVLAECHHARGKYRQTIELCKKIIAEDEPSAAVYALMAESFRYLRQYPEAIALFKKSLALGDTDLDNEITLLEISVFFDLCDNKREGIKFFKEYIDDYPFSYVAWHVLGRYYADLEEFEDAIQAYDYSVTISEDYSPAWFGLATVYYDVNNYRKAFDAYLKTIELDGPDPALFCNVGNCLVELNEIDLARTYFKKANSMDPEMGEVWLGIAISYSEEENYRAALPYIEKAIQLESEDIDFWIEYARILLNLDSGDKAEEALIHIVTQEPHRVPFWIDLALIVEESGREMEAINTLNLGIEHNPASAILRYKKAATLFNVRKIKEALMELETALQINPKENFHLFLHAPEAKELQEVNELIDYYLNQ